MSLKTSEQFWTKQCALGSSRDSLSAQTKKHTNKKNLQHETKQQVQNEHYCFQLPFAVFHYTWFKLGQAVNLVCIWKMCCNLNKTEKLASVKLASKRTRCASAHIFKKKKNTSVKQISTAHAYWSISLKKPCYPPFSYHRAFEFVLVGWYLGEVVEIRIHPPEAAVIAEVKLKASNSETAAGLQRTPPIIVHFWLTISSVPMGGTQQNLGISRGWL